MFCPTEVADSSARTILGLWKDAVHFLTLAQQPNAVQGHLSLVVSRSHTMTRHSR